MGVNFSDFWMNIEKEDTHNDPRKTSCFITQGNNEKIFAQIWNPVTVESFKSMANVLYPDSDSVGIDAFLKRIMHIHYFKREHQNEKGSVF